MTVSSSVGAEAKLGGAPGLVNPGGLVKQGSRRRKEESE
jgi:hypothetical protein